MEEEKPLLYLLPSRETLYALAASLSTDTAAYRQRYTLFYGCIGKDMDTQHSSICHAMHMPKEHTSNRNNSR